MLNVKRTPTKVLLEQITDTNHKMWNAFAEDLSPSTRKVYQSDILNYMVHIDKDITKADASDFIAYREGLISDGAEAATVNRKLGGIRSMYKFLVGKDYLAKNPLGDISFLELDKPKEKNVLTWKQVQHCKDLGGLKYDMFNMTYLQGLSLEDAATALGMTVSKFQYHLKGLREELGIPSLTYSDLIETRKHYHAVCPACGDEHEMSEGNWKFEDGLLVGVEC